MSARVEVYPAFQSQADLDDRYWRLAHYLSPVAASINAIRFDSSLRPASAPPAYFDSALVERVKLLEAKVDFSAPSDLSGADLLIVWDRGRAGDEVVRRHRNAHFIDPLMLHEGDLGIELGASLAARAPAQRAAAQQRLLAKIASARANIVHVFGTGPSLGNVDLTSLPKGAAVVCNSLIKDRALMEALKPAFIIAADPIYHAGPSCHAGAFREALAAALDGGDALFVTQERDTHIYEAILPAHLHSRIVGVPTKFALAPNLDLARKFQVTATRNVLTMIMLPLAAMVGSDVRLYGCDGRKPRERATFWSYDRRAEFAEEGRRQAEAHPGFFSLDVGEYYALHCETLRLWRAAMVRAGCEVRSATTSFIPILAENAMLGVPPAIPRAPPSLGLRGRVAFARRLMQSAYGALISSAEVPPLVRRFLQEIPVFARGLRRSISTLDVSR